MAAYRAEVVKHNVTPSDFYAGLTYDAVWAMALALNGSQAQLPPGKTLESFTYEDTAMRTIFEDQMYQVNFAGQSVGTLATSSSLFTHSNISQLSIIIPFIVVIIVVLFLHFIVITAINTIVSSFIYCCNIHLYEF